MLLCYSICSSKAYDPLPASKIHFSQLFGRRLQLVSEAVVGLEHRAVVPREGPLGEGGGNREFGMSVMTASV